MKATFTADEQAPAHARAFVGDALQTRRCVRIAVLAVSELVSNVVLHDPQSTEVTVALTISDATIRLEVAGNSAVRPTIARHPRWPSPDDTGGRGLMVVEAIADRWGVEDAEASNVWCEFDC